MSSLDALYAQRDSDPDSFWREVTSLALRYCRGDRDQAQEVVCRIYQALPSYRPTAPMSHWVSRIARRVRIDAIRARQRHPETALTDAEPMTSPTRTSHLADIDTSRLTAAQQELVMMVLLGLSYAEIGRRLHITRQAVRKRLRKLGSHLQR